MIVLKCEKHPQMQVNTPAGTVRFVDGVAEVTDEQAEATAALAESYGVTIEADTDTGPEELERPVKSASKSDWKAYAISQGMDEDAAEKATRDELAARYADGGDS